MEEHYQCLWDKHMTSYYSPVNEGQKSLNWEINGVVLKFGPVVGCSVLNCILKVPAEEIRSIDEGLDSLSSFSCSNGIWILTYRRSSIKHLANWHRVRDNAGRNILTSLSVSYRIHLPWIPSHVNIQGNESAHTLAKTGADDALVPSAPLTYLKLFSRS
ncbi:hypothetical protein AVEN_120591-1 [Araneus ventricosus]|uniref:RNase H type-1 domain-containing protein n=1 Tax=Araneus ventricosus TaxID=182803 RepID=A0A4Y2LFW7_ARAVE|nr:hypothetical protein AVEN_120591-1 [Araneus ventricosus]